MRRLLVILLVALALAPGLFWRDEPKVDTGPQRLQVAPLALEPGTRVGPNLVLAGAWELDSDSGEFGGYSALVPLPGGELLAVSDRGRLLRFDPWNSAATPTMRGIGAAAGGDKRSYDIESAARDPASGTLWLGYEGLNAIQRADADLLATSEVRPREMSHWPANRGAEAMARLADGRFVVLSEAVGGWQRPAAEGLLFASDPVEGEVPERFRFVPPAGFRPTDMAQLPDGRALILLRKIEFGLPPRLASRLVVADPATLAAGEEWAWQPFAEIAAPLPRENYEGLAIELRAGGAVRIWLISDDNSAVLQRTLLLALDWNPRSSSAAVVRKN